MGAAAHAILRSPRRWRLAALAVIVVAGALSFPSAGPAAADAGGRFHVTYDPPLGDVLAQGNPDSAKSLTQISVQALGPDGRPLRDVVIATTLTAPDPSAVVGSDVPRIEGRRLLHTSFGAPDGRYAFRYLLPIRGTYRLDLRAAPAPGAEAAFTPFAQTRTFAVGERSGELRKLVLALIAMFAFGAISAAIIARPHLRASTGAPTETGARGPGRAVPGAVGAVVALGLLFAAFAALLVVDSVREARVDGKVAGHQGPGRGADRSVRSAGAELRYHVSRTSEDGIGVQTLVQTRGSLLDPETGAAVPGAIKIEALDLETGKPAFTTLAPPAGGRFTWDFDYWDGVDYDVRVGALPAAGGASFEPLKSSVELAVEPLAPPLGVKFVGLAYLLAPLVAGILVGLLLARRRWRSRPLGSGRRAGLPAASGAR